jgi:hypothetical protein
MSQKYIYDHKPKKHFLKRSFKFLILVPIIALILSFIGYIIFISTTGKPVDVTGPTTKSGTIATVAYPVQTINEPDFTMQIPASWIQTSYINDSSQYSITWMDKNPKLDTRWLTVFVDNIPSLPINNILPVKAVGNKITYGLMSDDCTTFTPFERNQLSVGATYMGVSFVCNTTDIIDGVVGTGSIGTINKTAVTGPAEGTHNYFFEYTEHSGEPNYSYLDNALFSFRAK